MLPVKPKEYYADILKSQAKKINIELNQDINHLLKNERKSYVGTLENTYKSPDFTYVQENPSHNVQKYYAKKYINENTQEPFYDFLFVRDGKIFNKFNTDADYVANQFKTPMKGPAFHGHVYDDRAAGQHPYIMDIMMQKGAVVNSNLQNISNFYEGLNSGQVQHLDNAIISGAKQSVNKMGSLDNFAHIKNEVSQYPDLRGVNRKMNDVLSSAEQKIGISPYVGSIRQAIDSLTTDYP